MTTMTYVEQEQAKAAISKILRQEYTRKSKRVQDRELQRIYWNIAHACERDDAGTAAAKEAIYTMQHMPDDEGSLSLWKKNYRIKQKLQHVLNRRAELLEQFGIQVSLGM